MTEKTQPVDTEVKRPRGKVGRRAILTESMIIEAALDIGLEVLTIRKLAAALGVAPSSIYEYFASREVLIEAAVRHSLDDYDMVTPQGIGWRQYVTEFATTIVQRRIDHPEYIRFHIDGKDTTAIMAVLIRDFLGNLASYGFSSSDALWLLRRLGPLTLSASIEIVRLRGSAARGLDPAHSEATEAMRAELSETDMALVEDILSGADAEVMFGEGLELLLDRFAARVAAPGPARKRETEA